MDGRTTEAAPASALAGRYELGDLLGSGGMAEVYAARDLLLDRAVAIKFFRPFDERADRARFVGEARMLAGLSHPGLVTVFDASFEDHLRPCLIMRLVDGGTLRQRIDTNGPLEPRDVAALGARLATALTHVHANGIVHRDVKPSNVLIDAAGDYYLADFGLAWVLGSAHITKSGELVGTACYLAPEQVAGATVGAKADVYALGLVLLECLTGRTEYEGTDVEVAVARLSRPPVVPEHHGVAWRELLVAMTDNDPANRPDARECARRLHAIARAVPARAVPGCAVPAATQTTGRIEPVNIEPRKTGLGRLRAGAGAAGAAGLVLAAVLFTPTTGTAGEPVPDSSPGHTTTAPGNRPQHNQAPATAATTHAPTSTGSAQPAQVADVPAAKPAAPAKTVKPEHGAKAHDKPPAGPQPPKPGKPK